MAATLDTRLRAFIGERLPDGLDRHEVGEIAREVAQSPTPLASLDAVLARYGDHFTVDGAQAFQTAATVLGDDGLAEVADVFAKSRAAVGAAREAIGHIEGEIQELEAANATKRRQVDELVAGITRREDDIRRERENKRTLGFAFIFAGIPAGAVVSLHQMMQDDQRLQSLKQDKAAAEASRGALDQKIAAHQGLKAQLEPKLTALQKVADRLGHSLDVGAAPVKRSFVAVADSAAKLQRRERLLDNLQQQLALLEQIRDSAAGVGADLDAAIADLTVKVAQAAKLVEASKKDTFELVKISTSKDPNAAAEAWLKRKLAKETEALLRQVGASVDGYIDHLVKGAFPNGGPAATALKAELKRALSQG